jgi:acyl carrier protein
MHRDRIIENIRSFIVQHFPSAKGRPLAPDDRLLQNGIVDSLGVLNLVDYLEKEFGVTSDDDDLVPENFETLGRLAAFVEEKLGAASKESV